MHDAQSQKPKIFMMSFVDQSNFGSKSPMIEIHICPILDESISQTRIRL